MTGSACVAMRRALLTCFLRDAITLFLCLRVLSVDQSVSISPIRKTHESLKTGNRQSESRHRWENLFRVLPPPACHATVFANSLFCHPEPFPAPSSRFGPLKPNSCTQSPARPVPSHHRSSGRKRAHFPKGAIRHIRDIVHDPWRNCPGFLTMKSARFVSPSLGLRSSETGARPSAGF